MDRTSSLTAPAERDKTAYLWPVLALVLCLTGAGEAFSLNYISKGNLLIGICLLPFVLRAGAKPRVNYVYLAFMLGFGAVGWYYSVTAFYFFTLMLYALLMVEIYWGRQPVLVLFLVAFMSPVFQLVAVIIGFPVRLMLSSWAGQLMGWAGADVDVQGNLMTVQGAGFTVDDACMGLNMLAVSLLAGVWTIAHHGRLLNRQLPVHMLVAFFLVVFLFNLLSNLLRIVVLVMFRISAGSPLHEVMGLVCLAVYVFVPVYFLGRWWIRRWGLPGSMPERRTLPGTLFSFALVALAALILAMGVSIGRKKSGPSTVEPVKVHFPGFAATAMHDGVTKLNDHETLVYIKPIPEFFSAEHTPLLCWKGSGYAFKTVRETTIDDLPIYTGTLTRDGSTLYTAWWYSNGTVHTRDQTVWRWRMLKGEGRFCLVNVTAGDEEVLRHKVTTILQQDLLKTLNQKNDEHTANQSAR